MPKKKCLHKLELSGDKEFDKWFNKADVVIITIKKLKGKASTTVEFYQEVK